MLEDERRWKKCDGSTSQVEYENMSAWRVEDCPAYADTYIEWCFEKRCKEYGNGVYILTEWRERKKQYISYLKASVFDFQHYSRHDDSHSISILESIEMLLGKNRVDKLSIGDLWLLLESAYSHDLGMNLSYNDLVELWKRSDFQEYIEAVINNEKAGHEAVAFYKVVDNLLNGKVTFDNLEHYLERHPDAAEKFCNIDESWPVAMERGIEEIVSEFVRREHAKRLEESINKLDENSDPIVPIRLYKLMVRVCVCHGGDYSDILRLPPCEKGFGNSRIHPRFVAALLRMGDLLDMDNNRFNVRAIEHFGALPYMSSLHYKKHRDITHISIRPERIEAEAVCTEPEVCVVINSWFTMLSEEIKNLICHWNEMAPDAIKGCLLTVNPFRIYYEKNGLRRLFYTHPESDFQVDKGKMIELLMGANIYRSRIDFIREYLQNALDASKMRLWTDMKNGRLQYTGKISDKEDPRELFPLDLGKDIYGRYAIEIHIECNIETQMVELNIFDRGIGMEEECLNVISNIGGGWRKRKKYRKELMEMPKWLKPTGGFGIGIQSAFMVADCVEIITRGVHETEGRKIILSNPREEGRIVQESLSDVEVGTKVKVKFPLRCILDVQDELEQFPEEISQEHQKYPYELLENVFENENFFDARVMQNYVFSFVCNYVETYFCNTLIPIIVIAQESNHVIHRREIENKTVSRYNKYDRRERIKVVETDMDGKHYQFFYDNVSENRRKSIIWCDEDASLAMIEYAPQYEDMSYDLRGMEERVKIKKENRKNRRGFICFKNVRVNRELSVKSPYSPFYNVFEDFMGLRAEQILKIHREEFNTGFRWRAHADCFFKVYYQCLNILAGSTSVEVEKSASVENDVISEERKTLQAITDELMAPAAQIIQLLYLNVPLKEVKSVEKNFEIIKSASRYVEKIGILRLGYKMQENPVILENARMNLGDILESLDKILTYNENEQTEQPCIFIKPLHMEIAEASLISSSCEVSLLFEKSPEAFRYYVEQYLLKGILEQYKNETVDETFKSRLQAEMYNRINKICEDRDKKLWELTQSLGKSGVILTDRNIVPLIENYDGFAMEFFRLRGKEQIYAKITKKIQKSEPMNLREFYKQSYNRKDKGSQVFDAREVPWYPELRVKQLPIRRKRNKVGSAEYLISPINQDIFKIIETTRVTNSVKSERVTKIEFSWFLDLIINHPSYIALEQWVYEMQIGVNGKKLSKKDIREVYLKYIRKIYDEMV